jgi:hypothetical protein
MGATPREEANKITASLNKLKLTIDKVKPRDIENYVNVKLSRTTILGREVFLSDMDNLTDELIEILELEELKDGST